MSHGGESSDDWDKSFSEASSAIDISSSDFFQSDRPHRQVGQSARRDPFNTVLPSSAARPLDYLSSTLSIDSIGNEWVSSLGPTRSVSGVTPRFSAPEEAGNYASSSPSVVDSILEHFAQYAPLKLPAASPISQSTSSSSPTSYETTGSDEADSSSGESSPELVDEALETPATSDASLEADLLFDVDQDQNEEAPIPNNLVLVGLELRGEDRVLPPFFDGDKNSLADISNDILKFLENKYEQLQAEPTAKPWVPGAQDIRRDTSSSILAPPPGSTYNEYYSSVRGYTQRHREIQERKAIVASLNAQNTSWGSSHDGTSAGTPGNSQGTCAYTQHSSFETESRGRRARDRRDGTLEWLSETPRQSQICRAVDCVTFSSETFSSIFYPSFASSHLSYDSLEAFTTKLIAPNSLVDSLEYTVDVSLGFGGVFRHNVCTFTPRNKSDLQSYRKIQGEDNLCVQDSLPIALNLFSVHSHAEELDARLNRIVDSESGLEEYVDLMQRRKDEGLNVEILRCIVRWYSTSKNKLSPTERHISRVALKLLMTTTLLRLVPRVKNMDEPLSRYLSPQPYSINSAHLSPVAPKVLSRQIKTSIHYLQKELFQAIFCYFACALRLATDVKVATALLVAFVLQLAQNTGQEFAKFANTINSTVVVKQQDVAQYEMNIKTQIFGRVRAIISGSAGEMGQLEEMLRSLGSAVKGKGKEIQEFEFVSVILGDVL